MTWTVKPWALSAFPLRAGTIKTWDHPDIKRQNPELAEMGVFNGLNITYVVLKDYTDLERTFVRAMSRMVPKSFPLTDDIRSLAPIFKDLPFYDRLTPRIELDLASNIPDVVSFTPGAISLMGAADASLQLVVLFRLSDATWID